MDDLFFRRNGQNLIDYSCASETYDNTRRHDEAVLDRFNANVRMDVDTAVLDFGCGTGNYLAQMFLRFQCQCFGVEPNVEMREKAKAKNPGLRIVSGDHSHTPFVGESFDFVYMTDVVHHVPDRVAMFRELSRVLKPGGRICVVTESHSQIRSRFYNMFFPSLSYIETARYPDIESILVSAQTAELTPKGCESIPRLSQVVDDAFIQNVEQKNWSMFRLLSDKEFQTGLTEVRARQGSIIATPGAGTSLVWVQKSG